MRAISSAFICSFFFGEETMRAAHIANARDQNVQKNRRDRSPDHDARVTLENFSRRKIKYCHNFILFRTCPGFDARTQFKVLLYLIRRLPGNKGSRPRRDCV
jgi:hypothetical protein